LIPYVELRRRPDASVSYVREGKEHRYPRLAVDPAFPGDIPWTLQKLLLFLSDRSEHQGNVQPLKPGDMSYDLILVGTGFSSSFFLLEYLAASPKTARVLVIERGRRESRGWQLEHRRVSRISHRSTFESTGLRSKNWMFTLGFGGGSNCWWACTPRLLPSDFRMKTLYGVGDDWPISYDDLEPFYEAVEQVMAISGPADPPYPRRSPPPQPPHNLSDPDRLLARAYPGQYLAQATARARLPTGRRGVCCGTGVCSLCPVDAKFTIENGLAEVYADPRVTLQLGTEVRTVDLSGGRVTGVQLEQKGRVDRVAGDLVVLGAGAIFNVAILLRSGVQHPLLGRRLFEQMSVTADVDLRGVDNFQGSTVITGQGYMLYDGPHRSSRAACLIEGWNQPTELRSEPGRARQLMQLKFIFEDLPQERNRVTLGADDRPVLEFHDYSGYAYRGRDALPGRLDSLLAPLPVERIALGLQPSATEGHILGTTVMGRDAATSVVDRWMVHHDLRNLVVLGGGAFPTGSPTNPTLTISALALWSARHLLRKGAN
jgi:choline dehydrogenase-like flavoprotein